MNSITNDTTDIYLISSREVDTWFLMRSPWPVMTLVSCYLIFVTKVGPRLMRDREPFNIKTIMLIYNMYQTFSNMHLLSLLYVNEGAISYIWNYACIPLDRRINPYWYPINYGTWLYLVSKITDLLDTIFFVLRKKESHISFLHVYHHANMVLSTWIIMKYFKSEQVVVFGSINSFVHVVMYFYYFLSALGPAVQKYLGWKKYITRLQMIQFLMMIIYASTLVVRECSLPKFISIYAIVQCTIFFSLFINFYMKTYIKKSKIDPKTSFAIHEKIK